MQVTRRLSYTPSLVFAVVMALLALPVQAFDWTEECDQNQLSMNTCAAERFHAADARLNLLYSEQVAFLETDKAKAHLRDAQRAWVRFRDRDCLYQTGSREDSGSIWPLLHYTCLAEHTQKRILELEEYVACREDGCRL